MENIWSSLWNPAEPIEHLFTCLKEVFVQATNHPPAYTTEQLVSKAVTAIEATGLMPRTLLE